MEQNLAIERKNFHPTFHEGSYPRDQVEDVGLTYSFWEGQMSEFETYINEELQKQSIVIRILPTNRTKKFADILSFDKYVAQELEYWNQVLVTRPNPVFNSFVVLQSANNELQTAKEVFPSNPAEAMTRVRSSESQLNSFPLFRETAQGAFVHEQFEQSVERGSGAALYFLSPNYNGAISSMSHEVYKGFFEAHFRFHADAKRWASNEMAALLEQKNSADALFADIQIRFLALSSTMTVDSEVVRSQFIALSTEMNGFRDKWKSDMESWHNEVTKKVSDLEELYEKKLALAGPAWYWERLAQKYRWSGGIWAAVTGALITVGTVVGMNGLTALEVVLRSAQNTATAATQFSTDWSLVVPVTILFGVIVSVWVFAIRTTIRLALSGFHLVRDATERKHLSHYYLSLLRRNKIVDKDTQAIVLQSLFSRADTGLLKGESSPTMPSNLGEILKNFRG